MAKRKDDEGTTTDAAPTDRATARRERVKAALVKYRGMKRRAEGQAARTLERRIAELADELELLDADARA